MKKNVFPPHAQHFSFNKDSCIILYGLGFRGKSFFHSLTVNGYNVIGIFDAKYEEPSTYCNVPVCKLEAGEMVLHDELLDAVVIISLLNANIHRHVVEKLLDRGYHKIIYLPMPGDPFHTVTSRNVFRNVYEKISLSYSVTEEIPFTTRKPLSKGHSAFIKNLGGEKLVYVPVDCVKGGSDSHYKVLAQTLRARLFRYFLLGNDKLADIQKECSKIPFDLLRGKTFMEYANDRMELFSSFMAALSEEPSFFENSAGIGIWQKGAFYLSNDGNHRTIFQYVCGFYTAPLIIPNESYENWLNKNVFDEVKKYENDLVKKILCWHPYGSMVSFPWYDYQRGLMRFVHKFLRIAKLSKKNVLLITDDISYQAMAFSLSNCFVTVYVNDIDAVVVKSFFKLYQVENVSVIDDLCECRSVYDILWLPYKFIERERLEFDRMIDKVSPRYIGITDIRKSVSFVPLSGYVKMELEREYLYNSGVYDSMIWERE